MCFHSQNANVKHDFFTNMQCLDLADKEAIQISLIKLEGGSEGQEESIGVMPNLQSKGAYETKALKRRMNKWIAEKVRND
jgi:hypothetical protein